MATSFAAPTGNVRVWALPAASKPVKLTEITAGVDLTPVLPRDGFQVAFSSQTVDTSTLASPQDTSVPGTYSWGPITLNLNHDENSTAIYDLFPRNEEVFIVWRRFGGSETAAAVGQKVNVARCRVSSRVDDQFAANEAMRYTVELTVLDVVREGEAIVAGA